MVLLQESLQEQTLHFAEDHVIIADTGDNLQREVRNI